MTSRRAPPLTAWLSESASGVPLSADLDPLRRAGAIPRDETGASTKLDGPSRGAARSVANAAVRAVPDIQGHLEDNYLHRPSIYASFLLLWNGLTAPMVSGCPGRADGGLGYAR